MNISKKIYYAPSQGIYNRLFQVYCVKSAVYKGSSHFVPICHKLKHAPFLEQNDIYLPTRVLLKFVASSYWPTLSPSWTIQLDTAKRQLNGSLTRKLDQRRQPTVSYHLLRTQTVSSRIRFDKMLGLKQYIFISVDSDEPVLPPFKLRRAN